MNAGRFLRAAVLGCAVLGGVLPSAATSQATLQALQRKLPELLYTCPMHAEVLEEHPGSCPVCKMKLEPVRIEEDVWYACPIHAATLGPSPGRCPLDKRQKMPVVVTVHWTCEDNPDQKLMEPGPCGNGSARREVHQIRAHGDHNPRHGGQFYMAADNWHHVEGTYPRPGLFRMYFYDNFTKPIDIRSFTARLVGDGRPDVFLEPGRGNTMETPLDRDNLPLRLTVKVRFSKEAAESQFDFTFTDLSKEPASPPATTTTSAAKPAQVTSTPQRSASAASPRSTGVSTSASAAPSRSAAATSTPTPPSIPTSPSRPTLTNCEPNVTRTDVLLLSDALPPDQTSLLDLLASCETEVQKLIDAGQFGFVYQPTMLGKDIALALERFVSTLPDPRRKSASDSIRRLVLSAWQLDLYGDLGNQSKLTDAYKLFAAAVTDIKSAYGTQP
jgi:hypothetical protein